MSHTKSFFTVLRQRAGETRQRHAVVTAYLALGLSQLILNEGDRELFMPWMEEEKKIIMYRHWSGEEVKYPECFISISYWAGILEFRFPCVQTKIYIVVKKSFFWGERTVICFAAL